MGLLSPHLDDAAFAEVWSAQLAQGGPGSSQPGDPHLRACAECRVRYADFTGWLETMRADAFAEADEVFPAERLAVQQAQIIRRLEALDHPVRVIAFPRFARPVSSVPGGRQRWVAAAAAAGLVVGVGLGQVFNFGGTAERQGAVAQSQQIARGTMPVGERPAMGVLPAVSQASDEAFFYDAETVPSQVSVPESLQYLNAITPGARDYDPR